MYKIKINCESQTNLVFTPKNGRCLVFSTGKIISVGCKSEKSAKSSILEVHRFLKKFRCISQ
jgi:TATA-box binding protein (TBP) (component of TFIID and TFIIIB)